MPSGQNDYVDKMMTDARVQHETVNKLLKDFGIAGSFAVKVTDNGLMEQGKLG